MKTSLALERVRRANPVPIADAVDDRALYARITSEPGDARLARGNSSRRHRRSGLVVAIALAVAAVAASTAVAVSHWNSAPAVEPPVTKQEYLQAQHSLTMPPGRTWPTFRIQPNTVTGKGGGASLAVMVFEHAWECYWVDTIRTHDAAGQRRAHAELEQLVAKNILVAPRDAPEDWAPSPAPSVPYAIWADDGGLQYVKAGYAAAAAGKPARLIQSCRANS